MASRSYQTLRTSTEFFNLKNNGRFLKVNPWLVVNYIENEEMTLRPGWTISRKIGKAVLRNQLKRWCRVVLDHHVNVPVSCNFIFRPQTKDFYKKLDYATFSGSLNQGLATIAERVNSGVANQKVKS